MKQEINFRGTTAYRSDDSVDAYVQISTTANYPVVTAQGNTVGWESMGVDANSFNVWPSKDVRLCGITGVKCLSFTPGVYRIDLPAPGVYRIRGAFGVDDGAKGVNARVFDNTTLLSQIVPPQASVVPYIVDATNTHVTAADWPALNAPVDLSFSSSIFRFYHGGEVVSGVGDTFTYVSHISVETAPSGLSPASLRSYYMNQGWA